MAQVASSAYAIWTSFHTTPAKVRTCGAAPVARTAREPGRLPVSSRTQQAVTQRDPHRTAAWRTAREAKVPVTAMSARHSRLRTGGCQSASGARPVACWYWERLSGLMNPGAKTRAVAAQPAAARRPRFRIQRRSRRNSRICPMGRDASSGAGAARARPGPCVRRR
ncbi:hypothetical protein Sfr7A_22885 [Streptomyces xinghaiensis]|uniref:Uncharacterized protein n=1 Tax=Streptomyces xinghaiensis TaxID=1038928 RepID=A0A3R7EQ09_9ACTN|nr:hypothetical protein Sfr7A_22885 [Streptomyces xinghaiensis]RKM93722.1 hypothetical protein SFRA_021435 [Streptomyces xinghaiensis]RNC71473.1 hypothetical protein DC095_021285 [Streptomyces xinghaiensis]